MIALSEGEMSNDFLVRFGIEGEIIDKKYCTCAYIYIHSINIDISIDSSSGYSHPVNMKMLSNETSTNCVHGRFLSNN